MLNAVLLLPVFWLPHVQAAFYRELPPTVPSARKFARHADLSHEQRSPSPPCAGCLLPRASPRSASYCALSVRLQVSGSPLPTMP
jgi:hypothetical protein